MCVCVCVCVGREAGKMREQAAGQAGKGRKKSGGGVKGNKSGKGVRETITSVREKIEGGMEGEKREG